MHATSPTRLNVSVVRSGRKEIMLRLGDEEPAVRAEAPAVEPREAQSDGWTDDEDYFGASHAPQNRALYFGAPEESPIARRDAEILRLARLTEARGINVVAVLCELLMAEDKVRDYEKKTGRTLGRVSFSPPTPEDWKALDVLTEIIRKVPEALDCRRVVNMLQVLRKMWLLRGMMEGSLPPEHARLLGRIGAAIADPPKIRFGKPGPTKREMEILEVWERRERLGPEERQEAAEALGLEGWESVKTMGLRCARKCSPVILDYIRARNRAFPS